MFKPPIHGDLRSLQEGGANVEVPLGKGQFLLLRGRDSFDPQALNEVLQPLGFSAYLGSQSELAWAELERTVVDKGVSWVWQAVRIREALLPPFPNRCCAWNGI